MDFLDKLNKEQREAAEHIDGPCLVTAGAGTGKTSVLTARVANLINNGVKAENILAITFTNKAAKEMKERANKLADCEKSTIKTFHSFGLDIVKENLTKLGFKKRVIVIDEDNIDSILKRQLKAKGYSIKEDNIDLGIIKQAISFFKNKLMSEQEIDEFVEENKKFEIELAAILYDEYINYCKNHCYVDFDDLLILPIELFNNNSDILEKYQDKFQYILVDEYQDTNTAQYELLRLLASKYKNLFVVGDMNQCIYGFRMADYHNILNFKNDYSNAKDITLSQNYRSTNTILEGANSVILNNTERADVTLYSNNGIGQKIKHISFFSENEEAEIIAKKIKQLINSGCKADDITILYRKNQQSKLFEASLAQYSIPFNVVGNSFFDKEEIRHLIAYLRLIVNTDDDLALKRIINTPRRGIGNKSIESLENLAKNKNISMFDAIADDSKEQLLEFKELINNFIKVNSQGNLMDTVDTVLIHSGLVEMYLQSNDVQKREKSQVLYDFKSVVYNYLKENPQGTLNDFLDELGLSEDFDSNKKKKDGVTLMTLHKAKGLEFPIVFIVGADSALFTIKDGEEEEERRLMYVGITRAKNELYITSAKRRIVYGEPKISTPIIFIDEIDRKCIDFYRY